MSQIEHPLDQLAQSVHDARTTIRRHLASTPTPTACERFAGRTLDDIAASIRRYRAREEAADAFKRCGPTAYTSRRFRECELRIVPFADRRGAGSNIVVFPAPGPDPDAA